MYKTEKYIVSETGQQYKTGDMVSFKTINGGGCGGCIITKITDTVFWFVQGTSRKKSVQYKDLAEIS